MKRVNDAIKVAVISSLIFTTVITTELPVYAAGTYDPGSGNGTVECSISGTFTVSGHQVVSNQSCSGHAHIPDEVVTIEASAFAGASQLTSVSIPAMVDNIKASAFYGSNLQGGVTFRSGPSNFSYITIGNFAFASTSFSSIALPTVGFLSQTAFSDNRALTNIYFLGNLNYAPNLVAGMSSDPIFFEDIGPNPVAHVRPAGTGFPADGAYWKQRYDGRGGLLVNHGVFNITYNSNGGSAISDGVILDGVPISQPPIPTRTGYTFIGWSATEGGDVLSFPHSPQVISNMSLYAKWTAIPYTVTFQSNGGSAFDSSSYTTGGLAITLPTPTRSGYTFAGWYSDEEFSVRIGDAGDSYSPSGSTLDLTAHAKWTVNTFNLTYNYNSATGGNSNLSASFTSGATPITLPTPTRTGYTFAGWYSDSGFTSKIGDAGSSYFPTGTSLAINVYAKWDRNLVKAASTVKPTVTGAAKVSKTLTAKKGTWTGYPAPSVSYQWYACSGAISVPRSAVPTTCKKITGATKSTFKIASAQKGKFISVLVTGSSAGTTKTIWLSKSTSKVS